jgi:hypothetical protein
MYTRGIATLFISAIILGMFLGALIATALWLID